MTTITLHIDHAVIAEAAQMIYGWNSGEVLDHINMSEGFTLAALLDALHEHGLAEHIIREVWEGEADGDRDPLPWANGHGSRLSDEEHSARAENLVHNEGQERFLFAPRREWAAEPDTIAHYARLNEADAARRARATR